MEVLRKLVQAVQNDLPALWEQKQHVYSVQDEIVISSGKTTSNWASAGPAASGGIKAH